MVRADTPRARRADAIVEQTGPSDARRLAAWLDAEADHFEAQHTDSFRREGVVAGRSQAARILARELRDAADAADGHELPQRSDDPRDWQDGWGEPPEPCDTFEPSACRGCGQHATGLDQVGQPTCAQCYAGRSLAPVVDPAPHDGEE